jgi:outer membrane protein
MIKMKPLAILSCLLLLVSGAAVQTPRPTSGPGAAPATPAAGAVPNAKIAIVDIGEFREEIGELKQRYEKLRAEFAPRATELESMQTKLAAQQQLLQEKGPTYTPPQVRRLTAEIEQLKKEFDRKQEDYQDLARKREQEETGATYEKISKFLETYAQQRGITLVLEATRARETNLIVYLHPSADITADFIKEYNKAYPVAAAAPAPKKPSPR